MPLDAGFGARTRDADDHNRAQFDRLTMFAEPASLLGMLGLTRVPGAMAGTSRGARPAARISEIGSRAVTAPAKSTGGREVTSRDPPVDLATAPYHSSP
jgi:hypothetical protein